VHLVGFYYKTADQLIFYRQIKDAYNKNHA